LNQDGRSKILMSRNAELQLWINKIQEFFDWYMAILERTQRVRKLGHYAFVNDVSISIIRLNSMLKELNNLSTPKFKEYKKIKKSLEESIKQQIKALQLEAKYFQDIRDETLAGRFGAGAVAMAATRAGEMLKQSLAEFHAMFKE